MIKEMFEGFCMALADSVPGVSGGTIAFIMGFYDCFINSIHNVVLGNHEEKKQAIIFLAKLALGWIIGMGLAVFILSSLFESHIYIVSSLFIGFILGSIPLIIIEEKKSMQEIKKGLLFGILGILIVVGVTMLNKSKVDTSTQLNSFSLLLGIRLFFIGMVAISAMFLPGISGSTLLLIFGMYIPVITAVKEILLFDFSYLPSLIFFGCGVLVGGFTVVKIIQVCLKKYRPQMIYFIIGMMMGSLYAIVMGPTTLATPQLPLRLSTFHFVAAIIGFVIVIGLQKVKEKSE